ncbi:hypothetical protein ACQUJO_00135 [Ralstonia pseudosolanacearum]
MGIGLVWEGLLPAVQIRYDYWRSVAPVAILGAILIAWRFQTALVGSRYQERFSRREGSIGLADSWVAGILAGVVLTPLAAGVFATMVNQVIGVSYVATYEVVAKYIGRGRHTCYGLALVKVGDPLDRFEMCVPASQQEGTAIGERLQVSGRQSKYVNQMLSYTKKNAD